MILVCAEAHRHHSPAVTIKANSHNEISSHPRPGPVFRNTKRHTHVRWISFISSRLGGKGVMRQCGSIIDKVHYLPGVLRVEHVQVGRSETCVHSTWKLTCNINVGRVVRSVVTNYTCDQLMSTATLLCCCTGRFVASCWINCNVSDISCL